MPRNTSASANADLDNVTLGDVAQSAQGTAPAPEVNQDQGPGKDGTSPEAQAAKEEDITPEVLIDQRTGMPYLEPVTGAGTLVRTRNAGTAPADDNTSPDAKRQEHEQNIQSMDVPKTAAPRSGSSDRDLATAKTVKADPPRR